MNSLAQAASSRPPRAPRGPLFWSGLVLGAGFITFGLAGAWTDRADTHPAELAMWLGAAGVVHDFALAPIFVVVAWLTGRLPGHARTPVRLGLAMSALLTAIAWPLVRGWGAAASNPSLLPLDYGANLLAVLTAVWLAVSGAVAVLRRTSHHDRGRAREQ